MIIKIGRKNAMTKVSTEMQWILKCYVFGYELQKFLEFQYFRSRLKCENSPKNEESSRDSRRTVVL